MRLVTLNENNVVVETAIPIPGMGLTNRMVLADDVVQVGWLFDDMTRQFTTPGRRRWITKLAFDQRFTMDESVKLKLAQLVPARIADETDADYAARCAVPMQLQVLDGRLKMATYIDLDRVDTRSGVMALEQLGLLAVGRAMEILDGAIAVHEYHPEA